MSVHLLEREQMVSSPLEEVFAFFSQARNLEELTPPWLRFEMLTAEPVEMRPGTLIDYRLRLHGVPMRWTSVIEEWEPGHRFVDRQIRGPYRVWHHTHEFSPHPDGTTVRDRVCYELPLDRIGDLADRAFVRRDLNRVFDYRRDAVTRLLHETPAESLA
jgi:ligand-binding SRPBCC domain-containing protein